MLASPIGRSEMILLTDKEIRREATKLLSPVLTKYIEESDIAWANLGAKTQLKKVAEWLNLRKEGVYEGKIIKFAMRFSDWQAILDEAEE